MTNSRTGFESVSVQAKHPIDPNFSYDDLYRELDKLFADKYQKRNKVEYPTGRSKNVEEFNCIGYKRKKLPSVTGADPIEVIDYEMSKEEIFLIKALANSIKDFSVTLFPKEPADIQKFKEANVWLFNLLPAEKIQWGSQLRETDEWKETKALLKSAMEKSEYLSNKIKERSAADSKEFIKRQKKNGKPIPEQNVSEEHVYLESIDCLSKMLKNDKGILPVSYIVHERFSQLMNLLVTEEFALLNELSSNKFDKSALCLVGSANVNKILKQYNDAEQARMEQGSRLRKSNPIDIQPTSTALAYQRLVAPLNSQTPFSLVNNEKSPVVSIKDFHELKKKRNSKELSSDSDEKLIKIAQFVKALENNKVKAEYVGEMLGLRLFNSEPSSPSISPAHTKNSSPAHSKDSSPAHSRNDSDSEDYNDTGSSLSVSPRRNPSGSRYTSSTGVTPSSSPGNKAAIDKVEGNRRNSVSQSLSSPRIIVQDESNEQEGQAAPSLGSPRIKVSN